MVAMTYMLACTSKGLATIPMEGINACGIRKVIQAPGRYAIPLVVATGLPLSEPNALSERYPIEEVVFGDTFGSALPAFRC